MTKEAIKMSFLYLKPLAPFDENSACAILRKGGLDALYFTVSFGGFWDKTKTFRDFCIIDQH